jgi:hypothetical protein
MALRTASLVEPLTGARCVRRMGDAAFSGYARRRVARLDRRTADDAQHETLLRLVWRAVDTHFGRKHDFAGVRTVADYQERVPLRDYEAFWQSYWRPAFPTIRGVTWPGPVPYFALSSGTTSGCTKYIPVSREMVASNRRAALTTLALFRVAYPDRPIFTGRVFFLGGSTDLRPLAPRVWAGDVSGVAARELSPLLRAYSFPPLDLALETDWEHKVRLLAERGVHLPITAVTGAPSWLLALFDQVLRVSGRDRIIDVWPALQVLVHGGSRFDPYRNLFRRLIGDPRVQFLETYPCSEGFVAAQDPRYGLLRLIPDHGMFFEFIPVAELGSDRPTRHTAADIVPGVQYAVAFTTCAGLWSYLVGDTVCFESREPPLLRFTGRTRYYLSAFGEHLISEEIERAVARAAEATDAEVSDFHVGPVFPEVPGAAGRHRYLVEFVRPPQRLGQFAEALDAALRQANRDYETHRRHDLGLGPPEVWPVPRHGFAGWLKSRGQLGGQHKVPRMDNAGRLTAELSQAFAGCPGASVVG